MKPFDKRILILVLSLALPSPDAWPGKWQPVAISEDHSAWLFVDNSSIKRIKGKATARIMVEYADDQPGIPDTNYLSYVAIRDLIQFDCRKKLLLPLEEEYLDSGEGFLGGSDLSGENWRPIFPGSLIETAYDIACRKGKPEEIGRREAPWGAEPPDFQLSLEKLIGRENPRLLYSASIAFFNPTV